MKNKIINSVFALFLLSFSYAQDFSSGTNIINLGVGFGGAFGGFTTSSASPVFSASFERGIWEVPGPGVVSLGAYLGYKTFKNNTAFVDSDWSYTIIGFRGAYHYTGLEITKLDIYGGAMFSYRIFNGRGGNDFNSRPGGTAFVGGRWFFSNNFSVFAEGGYGVAFITVGGAYRF